MQIGLFYNLDCPWQKVWKMNPTEPALQNSVDRQDRICLSKMKTWQQLWDEILATS